LKTFFDSEDGAIPISRESSRETDEATRLCKTKLSVYEGGNAAAIGIVVGVVGEEYFRAVKDMAAMSN
jgi:hypothetical protein